MGGSEWRSRGTAGSTERSNQRVQATDGRRASARPRHAGTHDLLRVSARRFLLRFCRRFGR